MMDIIDKGTDANEALAKATSELTAVLPKP